MLQNRRMGDLHSQIKLEVIKDGKEFLKQQAKLNSSNVLAPKNLTMNNSLGSIDSKQKSAIQDAVYPPSKFGQMRRMSIKNTEKPENIIDQQSKGKISRSMTLLGLDDEKDKVKVKKKLDKSKKQTKRRVRKSSDDEFEYIEDERVNIRQDVKGIIRINDPRMSRWDLYIITLAFYNCFSIPFQTAFNPDIMDSAYFLIFNTCIDFCFILDIMFTFRTTYYDPVSGDEIYDKKSIARKYLLGRFIIDFLSTVPFDNIAKIFTDQETTALSVFSMLKLIRVTRLGRIIAKLNLKEDIKLVSQNINLMKYSL